MTTTNLKLVLTQSAKKTGGDKYETQSENNLHSSFFIYLPQSISRKNNQVIKNFNLTIDEIEKD
jgi:hypothetical protein